MMSLHLKSAFSPAEQEDGKRYLVETLWPESVDTQGLSPYKWIQELAPSYYMKETALWKKWHQDRFKDEYWKELQEPKRKYWFDRVGIEVKENVVTLLYGLKKKPCAIDASDTTVFYLKEFLMANYGSGDKQAE